ncbi:hypothetical protein SLA2020_030230 [Shorea laevis]
MSLATNLSYPYPFYSPTRYSSTLFLLHNHKPNISTDLSVSFNLDKACHKHPRKSHSFGVSCRFSSSIVEENDCNFNEAVSLFNKREYYKCHDVLEALWNKADDPARTLIHGILQCAVGLHHLFNQNHRGAMLELGEGLCKLRKMNFHRGPFHQFEHDIAATLHFIYQTQIELAACANDLCQTMDQSENSYLLLGSYAAGQHLYHLQNDPTNQIMYIVFNPQGSYGFGDPPMVELPILKATEEHLRII